LGQGGNTEYENLIVLCPNCHSRVHRENIPDKQQLRHYKLKQEIAYGLPILAKLTQEEAEFVRSIAALPEGEAILFTKSHHAFIAGKSIEDVQRRARMRIGLLYLETEGIVRSEFESPVLLRTGGYSISVNIRMTDKGARWVRYLRVSGRLAMLGNGPAA
jgi:hypothetical protein